MMPEENCNGNGNSNGERKRIKLFGETDINHYSPQKPQKVASGISATSGTSATIHEDESAKLQAMLQKEIRKSQVQESRKVQEPDQAETENGCASFNSFAKPGTRISADVSNAMESHPSGVTFEEGRDQSQSGRQNGSNRSLEP